MTRGRSSTVTQLLIGSVVAGALVLAPGASPVSAHTDFDFSVPADGETVSAPLDEVTVAFTLPVTLVGEGFEVLDPQENLLRPTSLTDDDRVFRLQFDPPLAGGDVGVRYVVRAEDGHELSGAFSFSIDAPAPTTAPATQPAPTTVPATQPAPTVLATEPVTTEPVTTEPVATVTVTAAPDRPVDSTAPSSTTTEAPPTTTPSAEPTSTVTTSDDDPVETTEADDDGGFDPAVVVAIGVALAVVAGGVALMRSRNTTTE